MGQLIKIFLVPVLVVFFAAPVHADLTLEQRQRDAASLVDLFIHRYGPLPWKIENLGLDFNKNVEEFMDKISKDISDIEFYEEIIRFTSLFQDAHVSVTLPSTYVSQLHFDVDWFNGDVLITEINREKLPKQAFPFEIGDQLISLGGKNVKALIQDLSHYGGYGQFFADQRYATGLLTNRPQWKIPQIPTGTVEVVIRSQKSGKEERVSLEWEESGFPISSFSERGIETEKSFPASTPSNNPEGYSYRKDTFFPMWHTFVERKTDPFISGVVVRGKYRIGYLRFHTWSELDRKQVTGFMEEEIRYLEENTDALIIDQTGNGGGSICLGEDVARFFITKETPTILFQLKPTRNWLMEYEPELVNLLEKESEEEMIALQKRLTEIIRNTLENGEDLTPPIPMCSGEEPILPYATSEGKIINYTKPKLMLINEMSCSTGDMFPAILQDSGEVTLFGSRTAGCGGNVVTSENLGYSDINVRVTWSLAVRPNEVLSSSGIKTHYIENVGVIPDISYGVMTAQDFSSGYQFYKETVLQTVMGLLQAK